MRDRLAAVFPDEFLKSSKGYGSMSGELLTAYRIIASFEQQKVCRVCPHMTDKHDMNCIECCPWRRANDAVAPKKQPMLHKPVAPKAQSKCATCGKKLGDNPFTTIWRNKPLKFCSGACFAGYFSKD